MVKTNKYKTTTITTKNAEGVYPIFERFSVHLINVKNIKTIFVNVLSDSLTPKLHFLIVISIIDKAFRKIFRGIDFYSSFITFPTPSIVVDLRLEKTLFNRPQTH